MGFLTAEFHGLGDAEGNQDGTHDCGSDDGDSASQNSGREQVNEQAYAKCSSYRLARLTSCEGLDVIQCASDAKFYRDCG